MQPGICCPNCQTVNTPTARFCGRCGTRLLADAPAPATDRDAPAPEPPPTRAEAAPHHAPPAYRPANPRPTPSPSSYATAFNVLVWLLPLAAAVLIALALPLLNAGAHLLDGALYKQALRDQNVYQRFPDLFAEQMLLTQDRLGQQAHIDFTGVGAADWKLLAQELVPADWLQSQVERLIDQLFAAASGSTSPNLAIPLSDITPRLGGEPGMRIYKQVIQTKRECDFDDFFTIMDWIDEDPSVRLPICNIPADLSEIGAWIGGYDDGDAMIRDLLKELPAQLPQELNLSDYMTIRMDRLATWLRAGRLLAWGCLALAALALLLTFAAPLGRRLTGGLLLWGLPLSLAGLLGLLEAWLLPWLVGGLIAGSFKGALAPGLTRIILEMSDTVTHAGAASLAWQSAALLALGLLLCLAAGLAWAYRRLAQK